MLPQIQKSPIFLLGAGFVAGLIEQAWKDERRCGRQRGEISVGFSGVSFTCRAVVSLAAGLRLTGAWPQFINHPKRSDSLVENRIPHQCQRTEPGIDGLARTNLRFS